MLPPGHVLVLAVRLRGRGEGPVPGLCAAQFGKAPQKQAGLSGSGHGCLPSNDMLPERRQRGQTTGNYDGLNCSLLVGGFNRGS